MQGSSVAGSSGMAPHGAASEAHGGHQGHAASPGRADCPALHWRSQLVLCLSQRTYQGLTLLQV